MRLTVNRNARISLGTTVCIHGKDIVSGEYTQDVIKLLEKLRAPRERNELYELFETKKIADENINALLDANVLVGELELRPKPLPLDIEKSADDTFKHINRLVRGYTMAAPPMNYALYQAVAYIVRSHIPGDVVLTGIWRGGGAALCAYTLKAYNEIQRNIYMYDTYDWCWPTPTTKDSTNYGRDQAATWQFVVKQKELAQSEEWLDEQLISSDKVKAYLEQTDYPKEKFCFVKGEVTETIPGTTPESAALIHLDTDFYESTYHELTHLYPKLVPGGVLIIDDYPTEAGCTAATDEFFSQQPFWPYMHRVGHQGRVLIKPQKH